LEGTVTPDTPVKKGQAGTWHRANDVHGLIVTGSSRNASAMAALSPKPASSASTPTPRPPRVAPPALPQAAASSPASQPSDIFESIVDKEISDPNGDIASEETTTCPFCGEEILAVASKCKHCGEFLGRERNRRKIAETTGSDKRILPLFLLWLFLGLVGVHAFYAGRVVLGMIHMIVLLPFTLLAPAIAREPGAGFLAFVLLAFPGVCLLVELIQILVGEFKDGNEKPITKWT
jgi:predicted nucleic acid-binding Zn ribbon protein